MNHMTIDKTSMIPVYHQIARQLKALIEDESLENGDLIPSERELCDTFGVSRMTVRQAIDVLVNEGALVRQKGKGTFVSTAKLSQPLTSLSSFTVDTIGRGMVPTSDVLSCEAVFAGEKTARMLGIGKDDLIIRLERVRLANGKPHAFECSHLLYEKTAGILEMDLTNRSLYEVLQNECGMNLASAKEVIEANICPSRICRVLQIPEKSLTFHIERITFDSYGRPVEYVESNYRTDKFKFEVELNLK